MTVTLIGLAGGLLPPGAGQALATARLVVGVDKVLHRHVAAAYGGPWRGSEPGEPRLLEVPGSPGGLPPAALEALAAAVEVGESAVVLVSGDPGYFGALRELRNRGLPTECLPAVSHVQRVASLIQRPWDDVSVVSARGNGFHRAVNVCRARRRSEC